MNLINFLFPKECLGCKREGVYLCQSCIRKSRFARQSCIECGKPSIDGLTHTVCKKHLSLDGIVSVWVYEKVIREAIITLKYRFAYEIAKDLSIFVSKYLERNIHALPKKAVLTPLPLHKFRQNWRGFNQSACIARFIAEHMNWEYQENVVVRKKGSRPQTNLKRGERKKNVFRIFFLNPDHFRLKTDYIIFDDVITTGATLKEVGKVIKKGGAKAVWGLTIAR